MGNKLIYLAGPITGLSFGECTDWRDKVRIKMDEYGLKGLSPLRGKDYLLNERELKDRYDMNVMSTSKGITRRDMNDVRQCDVVLVNVLGAKKVSIGTILEIGAAFVLNKPIILVMEDNNIHSHAMVEEMCGWIVKDLEEAVDIAAYITGVHKLEAKVV